MMAAMVLGAEGVQLGNFTVLTLYTLEYPSLSLTLVANMFNTLLLFFCVCVSFSFPSTMYRQSVRDLHRGVLTPCLEGLGRAVKGQRIFECLTIFRFLKLKYSERCALFLPELTLTFSFAKHISLKCLNVFYSFVTGGRHALNDEATEPRAVT